MKKRIISDFFWAPDATKNEAKPLIEFFDVCNVSENLTGTF